MNHSFVILGRQFSTDVKVSGERLQVDVGKGPIDVDARRISAQCLSLIVKGRSYTAYVVANERKRYIHIDGHHFCVEEAEDEVGTGYVREGSTTADRSVTAPMPGTIVAIQVKEGDEVEKNQSLVIVESMKMENALRSPLHGRIAKIHFKSGDLVDAGVPIVELLPVEETD